MLSFCVASGAWASDCSGTSFGLVPLGDLGQGFYLGVFQGGLYPDGQNTPPSAHFDEGLTRALEIQPLNTQGDPDPQGKIVLLSIGMSNTTQEFCSHDSFEPCDAWTFVGQASEHPDVNSETLVFVNGARAAEATRDWNSSERSSYDRVLDDQLLPKGLSEAQVQVIWMKHATPRPQVSLPAADADAFDMLEVLGDVVRAAQTRYPNCSIIFFSSRIYAGYASTDLSPEPFSYESGFSVKWLIEAQINQLNGDGIDPIAGDLNYDAVAPWLAWGPYLWADGLVERSDGLTWECVDFEDRDGTHPSQSAEEKVATRLLDFMLTSPFSSPWFKVVADSQDGLIPDDEADGPPNDNPPPDEDQNDPDGTTSNDLGSADSTSDDLAGPADVGAAPCGLAGIATWSILASTLLLLRVRTSSERRRPRSRSA